MSHDTIHVIVESGSGSNTTDFRFRGTSDYPPNCRRPRKRQRHQAELKKIPHVRSVELDEDKQDRISIDVTVTDSEDIEGVRRQVPPQIEGYETEKRSLPTTRTKTQSVGRTEVAAVYRARSSCPASKGTRFPMTTTTSLPPIRAMSCSPDGAAIRSARAMSTGRRNLPSCRPSWPATRLR